MLVNSYSFLEEGEINILETSNASLELYSAWETRDEESVESVCNLSIPD